MTHCYTIDKCIPLLFLEKLFLAADRNEHRRPQLDNVQRMRDCGAHSTGCDVFIKPLPSRLSDRHRWRWNNDLKEAESSRHSRMTCIRAHRYMTDARDLYRFKSDKIPTLRK